MRYFQKLLCLLILVLAASFGVGGCVLLYSDFSVQRSRMAAANAAAHAQACTLLQTEILDLQRRGISTGDAALTARVTAQNVPAALWRGDTLVCATLEGLQNFPLGDAATVTVRTENSIYAVYASDLQGGLRLVTAYDLTGLYRDRNAALMRFLLLEAAVLAAASAVTALLARRLTRPLAVLTDAEGRDHEVTMVQKWPVKQAVRCYTEKPRPSRIMETGVRPIDTFNPMAEGGTGFIPGPFGAGKTVLQHAISKQADADVIIMVACGERANEVVEIFKEFPELIDPHTGHTLMERTIIICNTSNMPVAAREASVYTGMTIGEYYRSMGLKVLVMADSTSRWAQALREMSNRLEELPGQDAFPMDLSAIISNFYSRAGLVKLVGGQTGSVTFLGTVSPAGGNLKEPVTESTKKAARCFYALSQGRADSKRYPAIDPLESYSKYLEYPEIREYLDEHIEKDWVDLVYAGKTIVQRGKEANDQINILGDDGVPVEYHERFWKSELIDFVILQQDAFDDIDANCPMERQQMMYKMVLGICNQEFAFADFEACSQFFKGLINLFRQMNYSEWKSEKFEGYRKQIEQYVSEQSK